MAFQGGQLVKIRKDGREGDKLSLKPGANLSIGRWVNCCSVVGSGPARGLGGAAGPAAMGEEGGREVVVCMRV